MATGRWSRLRADPSPWPRRWRALPSAMALYTPLSAEELGEVAARYGLPPPERHVAEPKGSVNTNYHLWAGGRRLFLRLNEGKTDAEVEFETGVLRFLEAAGYPSARLLLALDGRAFVRARSEERRVGKECRS